MQNKQKFELSWLEPDSVRHQLCISSTPHNIQFSWNRTVSGISGSQTFGRWEPEEVRHQRVVNQIVF
jgi:hypothetical protein